MSSGATVYTREREGKWKMIAKLGTKGEIGLDRTSVSMTKKASPASPIFI